MRKRLYLCRLGRHLPKEFKNEHIISWIFLRGDFELLDVPFVLLFKKHHACFLSVGAASCHYADIFVVLIGIFRV